VLAGRCELAAFVGDIKAECAELSDLDVTRMWLELEMSGDCVVYSELGALCASAASKAAREEAAVRGGGLILYGRDRGEWCWTYEPETEKPPDCSAVPGRGAKGQRS
jgi:hypothetical protein